MPAKPGYHRTAISCGPKGRISLQKAAHEAAFCLLSYAESGEDRLGDVVAGHTAGDAADAGDCLLGVTEEGVRRHAHSGGVHGGTQVLGGLLHEPGLPLGGDQHANPRGSYLTNRAAREVWKLYGCEERCQAWYRTGVHNHGWRDFNALFDFIDAVRYGAPLPADITRVPYADLQPLHDWTCPQG